MRISDWSSDVCSSDLPEDPSDLVLFDRNTGERFTFNSRQELDHFKYQRYIKRYLRTVVAIDENVGRLLDWLDEDGIAEDTIVVYTSDQGFFLGEHGWFDKREDERRAGKEWAST